MKSDERKAYEKRYREQYAKTHRQVTITLANADYRDFAQQAKKENTKVATLIRNMATAYLHQDALMPVAVEKELADLKLLIRNIANNVNQMAHHSNRLREMTEENQLLSEIQKLETLVHEYAKSKYRR